jgi:hypothetical protein
VATSNFIAALSSFFPRVDLLEFNKLSLSLSSDFLSSASLSLVTAYLDFLGGIFIRKNNFYLFDYQLKTFPFIYFIGGKLSEHLRIYLIIIGI